MNNISNNVSAAAAIPTSSNESNLSAKAQADRRRRISMGRITEQMDEDDDDSSNNCNESSDPFSLPSQPTNTACPTTAPVAPQLQQSGGFLFQAQLPPPPSSSSNVVTRRGPVPVPPSSFSIKPSTTASTAPQQQQQQPAFRVLCDLPQDTQQQQMRANQPSTTATGRLHVVPPPAHRITTGAEQAKENVQPTAAAMAGYKFGSAMMKPAMLTGNARGLPYEYQPDAEDASPLKKQRTHTTLPSNNANNTNGGGFRFLNNPPPPPPPLPTSASDYLTGHKQQQHQVDLDNVLHRPSSQQSLQQQQQPTGRKLFR